MDDYAPPLLTATNTTVNLLLMFLFVVNVSDGLYSPIVSVFITRHIEGGTLATAGFALAIYSIAKSLVQIPAAQGIDRTRGERDDFSVLLTGAVLTVIGTFAFMFVQTSVQLYALSILNGIGTAFLMAAYYAIFSRHVDRGKEGYEWSLLSVGPLTIASAVGAAIGGLFADCFGFPMTFFVAGSLAAAAATLLSFLWPILSVPHRHHGKPRK